MPSFRRCIELESRFNHDGGQIRAVLEDDFHHFRVALRFSNGSVNAIGAEAPRHPFTTCPGAGEALAALVGMPLDPVATAVTRHTDAAQQCTHMFDLAGLAIAAAARRIPHRRYDMEVPRHVDGRSIARLVRDDGFLLQWAVHESTILGPAPYSNIDMRRGMAHWAIETLDEDEAEAAIVLRRCALISLGRRLGVQTGPHTHLAGHCYTHQPVRAQQAIRIAESTLDFTETPHALCVDDRAWLLDFGS